MNRILLAISLITLPFIIKAHRGQFVSIENVLIEENNKTYTYNFQFENIEQQELHNITIELVINSKTVQSMEIPVVPRMIKYLNRKFIINKKGFDIKKDVVQIEVTKIFGKRNDWGGWDSPNYIPEIKQANTLYSETYADAPWRMKKTDENGNLNSIPVHFFIHDANKLVAMTLQLDYVNIRIKNASSNTFGPVLTYNMLNDATYKSMFSATSPNDPHLEIQEFKPTSFINSTNYTMDFNQDTDIFGDNFLEITEPYWYFTFNIPPSNLVGMEDIIDIEVTASFSNFSISDVNIGLRVFRSDEDIPKLENWYRGDTHLHSLFTQNNAEIGLPIESTIEAGRCIGLDWFTSTDHTSDYDNYGGGNIYANWNKILQIVENLNNQNTDFKVVAGQEVSTTNAKGKLVHMLAYPSYKAPFSLPFLSDGHGDLISTSSTIDNVVSLLQDSEGFSYAAHPFSTIDKLPTIPVNGGIWNLGELSFPANNSSFPKTGGNIICNETNSTSDILSVNSEEFIKDRIVGAQIWNIRNGRKTPSGSELDPWNIRGNSTPFNVVDTASYSHHIKSFRQGQEIVNHINKLALKSKNSNKQLKNWKMYISAGADAHGSFNFSNTDDFGGFGDINTNAVGKLTTLVHCPNGMGADGENILKSLYKGNSTLSDGPIAIIGISNNGNDNTNEILMGVDTLVNKNKIENYYLNINYVSTQEFGNFNSLKIIVGTEEGEIEKQLSLPFSNGNRYLTYPLQDILDSVFVNNNVSIPQDKYFYIRAELQTYKDYSSISSIYRSSYDIFHSFTNPIWIKLTEVEEINDFEIEVYPNPFKDNLTITVKNPTNEPVKINIYNYLGQLVSSSLHYVEGVKNVSISTNKLSQGHYTIKASVKEYEDVKKVIKSL